MLDRIRKRFAEKAAREKNGAQICNIAGLKVAVWAPAKKVSPPASGDSPSASSLSSPKSSRLVPDNGVTPSPAPLVIFSHGFRGLNLQSIDIMRALARAGYLVMAPNHRDAIVSGEFIGRPQQPFANADTWSEVTYKDRGEDIAALVSALKADSYWAPRIDWSRFALMGHSLGGYTALALAGGWPTWRLADVKAVVALSPYTMPFASKDTFKEIHVPVMYQTGTADLGVKPFLNGPRGAFSRTRSPAYLVDITGANHFTWSNLNRQQKKEDLIEYYCVSFLDKFVKGDAAADPARKLPGVSSLKVK